MSGVIQQTQICTAANSKFPNVSNELQQSEILIVDYKLLNLQTLAEMLKDSGYKVRIAANGDRALHEAKLKAPDLILMGICMPNSDGYAACRRLKQDPALQQIPVIFISALASTEEKTRAFEVGGVDYITKPFVIQEVRARVTTHLNLSRMQKDLEERNRHLQQKVEEQLQQVSIAETSTILALANLAEFHDADTGPHLDRVRKICSSLALALREKTKYKGIVTADFIEAIYQTSALHDIGKIGIPDHILLKPGKLTDAEFEIIKTHTVIGKQVLKAIYRQCPNQRLEMALEISQSHHEKWDGSGYPDGLTGEAIPLCARIMGLADVYDAIRSRRCYKDAMSHEAALSIIEQGCGREFDPDVVDAFLKLQDEFLKIYNEH